MPRTKPTPEPVMKDWDEVNDALREIAEIDRETKAVEIQLNAEIDTLKEAADAETRDALARKARLEKDLEEFCDANREDFGAVKHVALTFGRLSYRIVHTLKPASRMTWAKVLDQLKSLGRRGAAYIRVKETVDKDELRDLAIAGEDVSDYGVRLCTTDDFGYTLDQEAIDKAAQRDIA